MTVPITHCNARSHLELIIVLIQNHYLVLLATKLSKNGVGEPNTRLEIVKMSVRRDMNIGRIFLDKGYVKS
jgi:hypothetical protein